MAEKIGARRMELNSSAVVGAMRLGLQVVSALKRPSVEVFSQLRHTSHPVKFRGPDGKGDETDRTEILVAFFAANIGGRHAEDVTFDMSRTSFERPEPRGWGERLTATVPIMSPGQTQLLFLLDASEFNRLEWKGNVGTPVGWKDEPIIVIVRFNGPSEWKNALPRWFFNRLLKRTQYEFKYEFNPISLVGDLPPLERS